MIQINTKFKIVVPNMDFTEDLNFIAQRFIETMQNYINDKTSIDGTSLPDNELATKQRKRFKGGPLIDTGILRTSFIKISLGKNKVMITLATIRKNIGEYLQFDGVKTKSGVKYYRFFGINPLMETAARNYMEKKVKEKINGRS
jgi:hypothetical protein